MPDVVLAFALDPSLSESPSLPVAKGGAEAAPVSGARTAFEMEDIDILNSMAFLTHWPLRCSATARHRRIMFQWVRLVGRQSVQPHKTAARISNYPQSSGSALRAGIAVNLNAWRMLPGKLASKLPPMRAPGLPVTVKVPSSG